MSLKLVPTEALLDELARRHPNGLLVCMKIDDPDSPTPVMIDQQGSVQEILTLIKFAEWNIAASYMGVHDTFGELDDDEE